MKPFKACTLIKLVFLSVLISTYVEADDVSDLPSLSTGNLSSGADAILLNAGTEKKTAYLKLAMPGKSIDNGELKWDIAVETPYDDSGESGASTFADFDGVANSTNLQLNVSYWSIDTRPASSVSAIKTMMEKLCREFLSDDSHIGGCGTGQITKDAYCKAKNIADCNNESDDNYRLYVEQFEYQREKRRAELAQRGFSEPISANIFGFKSKIGRENFKFKTGTTFADQEQTESPWSITAYYYRKSGRTVWGGGLEYQESYTVSSETQICSPVPVPENATSCSNVVIGEPAQTRRKMAYVELRWANPEMNFAIAPKVTRDFENDETGILLPLYLMRGDKDALTGGISIGWQSETDDVTASIFVGKAFEFF